MFDVQHILELADVETERLQKGDIPPPCPGQLVEDEHHVAGGDLLRHVADSVLQLGQKLGGKLIRVVEQT